jgi:hypothetical protein
VIDCAARNNRFSNRSTTERVARSFHFAPGRNDFVPIFPIP